MAHWLYVAAVVAALFGGSSARSIGDASKRRSLQQASAQCGNQGYIIGESYCVTIGTRKWICPVDQPCACPTRRTGLNSFECYDPTIQSCSDAAPTWPLTGKINGVGQSDQGACPSSGAPAPAPAFGPAFAPAPAPAFGPAFAPAPGPSVGPAPMSEPAPSM